MTRSTDYATLSAFLYTLASEVRRTPSLSALEEALAVRGYDASWRREHVRPPAEADLHLHSNVSDASPTPVELVRVAAVLGLQAIALVDHDNVGGVREAALESVQLGLEFWPGLEFSTGRPGCEILLYWPRAVDTLAFLISPAAKPLHDYLYHRQQAVHADTGAVLGAVNEFLRGLDPIGDRPVALADLDAWYRGRRPYYPGTLAALCLSRMSETERERTGLHDPRQVYTAVLIPVLRARRSTDRLDEVLAIIRHLRLNGPPCLAVLAHPKELLTKGRMSILEVQEFLASLAGPDGLDGLEVNNSRDDAADTGNWVRLMNGVNERRAARGLRPWLGFSHGSDSHILAPGTVTGELTPGYGLLDERPAFQGGI